MALVILTSWYLPCMQSPPTLYIIASLWHHKNSTEDGCSTSLPRLVMTDIGVSALVSLESLTLREASLCVLEILKQSYGKASIRNWKKELRSSSNKELKLTYKPCEWTTLKADSTAPVKYSNDSSQGWHLYYLMKDIWARTAQLNAPKFLTRETEREKVLIVVLSHFYGNLLHSNK